ncbi:MAG: Xaa-Pro aminopeptidase [Planctomycetaceae bacterium]|jgi:Xaa-Pro aminopeptidase
MNESSVRELTESAEEYRDRVNRLLTALRDDGLNAALIFNPDHIFWPTGKSHPYFWANTIHDIRMNRLQP